MMRKLGYVVICIVLALGIWLLVHYRSSHQGFISVTVTTRDAGSQADQFAPELSVTDLSGAVLNTASLKGKVMMVNFWAAWCTPCADEVPRFVELQQRYQDQGLQIVGISIDDSDRELRDFYRKFKMNYPVIAGDQKLAQAYGGILGLPTTFVIGRDGRIHGKHTGSTDFGALEQEVAALLRLPNPN
jgi:thiol-disulfide isomerase/thioredoxin